MYEVRKWHRDMEALVTDTNFRLVELHQLPGPQAIRETLTHDDFMVFRLSRKLPQHKTLVQGVQGLFRGFSEHRPSRPKRHQPFPGTDKLVKTIHQRVVAVKADAGFQYELLANRRQQALRAFQGLSVEAKLKVRKKAADTLTEP